MKKITIAIDGFSSTGKSTLAKRLAQALSYIYVDTGAMYRAVTWYALQHQFISDTAFDAEGLIAQLPHIKLTFEYQNNATSADMYLNGVNVEKNIRGLHVSQFVSQVAAISEIRAFLVSQQKVLGQEKGVVMDGRDIGTVVFPDAELKIFMTASAPIRAQRRYDELKSKGVEVSYEEVFANVTQRDAIDTQRTDSPLKQAADAITLDNSALTQEEQFVQVFQLAQTTIAQYSTL